MLPFYAGYLREIAVKLRGYVSVWRTTRRRILEEVLTAPDRWDYRDLSITPIAEAEFEQLDLYHATAGGEAALARKRRAERPPTQIVAEVGEA
jgi:hypothetical protein